MENMRPYALLEDLLRAIEEQINDMTAEMPSVDGFALSLNLSSVHLQRMFKFAFGIPIAGYIRSRRLSASLVDLLKEGRSVLEIAIQYGFKYEQSYIRAFKKEFGSTPGELRRSGRVIKITPPLQLSDANKLMDGVFFGPEIVMVPRFQVIGKRHRIPYRSGFDLAPIAAKEFWHTERQRMKNTVHPEVYIGFTRIPHGTDYSWYLPSVQVESLKTIPAGLEGEVFEASLCARFHYIGRHHYDDINADVARGMYQAIMAFSNGEHAKYHSYHDRLFFERIDTAAYDGTYCQMEWFTPVMEKVAET